jgi:hypothetical protein
MTPAAGAGNALLALPARGALGALEVPAGRSARMTFSMRPSSRVAAAWRVDALSPAVLKTTTVLSPTMDSTRSTVLSADEAPRVGPKTYTGARRTAILASSCGPAGSSRLRLSGIVFAYVAGLRSHVGQTWTSSGNGHPVSPTGVQSPGRS